MANASDTKTVDAEKTGDSFIENVNQAGWVTNQEDHDVGASKAIRKYPWVLDWCFYAL
jgi:hypothetical protein